jgi:hypothetical protein
MESEDMSSEEKLVRKLSLDWGILSYFFGIPYFLGNCCLKSIEGEFYGVDAWRVER